jgi:hypothetical protein
MKRLIVHPVWFAIALVLTAAQLAPAQTAVIWNTPMGEWSDGLNWINNFAPSADVGEFGTINNGGVATVTSAVPDNPGGVILGQAAANSGTLEVQSGGTITFVDDEFFAINGEVTVGGAGTGTLVVERGGTLSALSLRSGGNAASAINLGAGDAGTATIDISGNTTLTRQTRLIGADVALSTGSLDLLGTLTTEIGSGGHSMILVGGEADLGGVLNLEFTGGFVPGPDDTFDLIDAATISGTFAAVNSNVNPGVGLAYAVQKVPGGANGTLARVAAEVQLVLQVDRRTGAARIRNLAQSRAVAINAYGVTSAGGVLDDAQWTPFNEGGPWSGNGSSTHVTELSYTGSRDIGPGADISLGNIYAFTPTELGESLEDLTFQYHVAGGDILGGVIEYTGAHNNLVLVVDEENGVFLQNQSLQDISINGYAIVSESGGLNPDEWMSFVDAGNADWTESNAAANHITELNQSGSLLLEAEGQAIPLGMLHSAGAMRDLQFTFNIAGEGPFAGVVDYDQGVLEFMDMLLVGDYNGNGTVEQADLDLVLLNWGDTLADPAGIGWVNDLPSGPVDQEELDDVLLNWGSGAAQAVGAAAVPEPQSWVLAVTLMLCICAQAPVRCIRARLS